MRSGQQSGKIRSLITGEGGAIAREAHLACSGSSLSPLRISKARNLSQD